MMTNSLDTLQASFRELSGYDGSMVLSVRGEVIAVSINNKDNKIIGNILWKRSIWIPKKQSGGDVDWFWVK